MDERLSSRKHTESSCIVAMSTVFSLLFFIVSVFFLFLSLSLCG